MAKHVSSCSEAKMTGRYMWSSSCLTGHNWGRKKNVFILPSPEAKLLVVWLCNTTSLNVCVTFHNNPWIRRSLRTVLDHNL